jgi:ketosteroid isomerase-like protein
MRPLFALSFLLVLFSVALPAASKPAPNDPQQLVEMELAFSKKVASDGIRDAFLAYLGEDSIVFVPEATSGRKSYGDRATISGVLDWHPIFAAMSQAGDLGYTTGPYTSIRDGKTVYGDYVTLWKKMPDQEWKVVVDTGAPHAQPPGSSPALTVHQPAGSFTRGKATLKEAKARKQALLEEDRAFSKLSADTEVVAAYQTYLSDEARLLRRGELPIVGKAAALKFLQATTGTNTWQPAAGAVSVSEDLGYTYGTWEMKDTANSKESRSSYLRIWRKEKHNAWRVVLEVTIPQ